MNNEVHIQIFRDKRIDMITLGEFIRGVTKSLYDGKSKVSRDLDVDMLIGPLDFDIALEAIRGEGDISYMTVFQDFDNVHDRSNLNRIKFTINLGSENSGGE